MACNYICIPLLLCSSSSMIYFADELKMSNVNDYSQFLASTCVWVVIAVLQGFQIVHCTILPDVHLQRACDS